MEINTRIKDDRVSVGFLEVGDTFMITDYISKVFMVIELEGEDKEFVAAIQLNGVGVGKILKFYEEDLVLAVSTYDTKVRKII